MYTTNCSSVKSVCYLGEFHVCIESPDTVYSAIVFKKKWNSISDNRFNIAIGYCKEINVF